MTNSGVPQFPKPGQYRPDSAHPSPREDNKARSIGKLDRAPDEIRREITARRQDIRAKGEVTRVDPSGNIRISTPRGPIDVQIPVDQNQAPRPQVGQFVEVEITPPARDSTNQAAQVIIRPAPEVKPSAELQPPARSSATPVEIEVRDAERAAPPPRVEITRPDPNVPAPANKFPESGSLVRLDPITPAQLETLVKNAQTLTPQEAQTILNISGVASDALNIPATGSLNVPVALASYVPLAGDDGVLLTPLPSSDKAPVFHTPTTLSLDIPARENSLSVPVLNRAQAAIAQLQNAAGRVLGDPQGAPSPPVSQDARVGIISAPQPNIGGLDQTQNILTSSQNAAQISGIVIAKTQDHVPIVQFSVPQNAGQPLTQALLNTPLNAPLSPVDQQTFMLQFPSDALLLGSRIDVTPQNSLTIPVSTSQGAPIIQTLSPIPFANVAFSQPWPVMQEIQQTLMQSTAQNAAQTAQAFSSVIPNPANSAQFGTAALFFVAAMRGGDLGSWLSDKASDILRNAGKGSLLSRAASEASGLSRVGDAPASEWRGMHIPLMWDGDIQKIALHYRHDSAQNDSDDKQSGNKGTRFIFDLNLDVMGKIQLDGFFRPVSQSGPRLDVILRSEERFSAAMQAEMRRVYMDAIKPSQVGGELSFQDGLDAWVMIDALDKRELGVNA